MEVIFYFIAFLSLCGNGFLGYLLKKSIDRISELEEGIDNVKEPTENLYLMCKSILDKDIYSNEPVIMQLVGQIEKTEFELANISAEFGWEIAESLEEKLKELEQLEEK